MSDEKGFQAPGTFVLAIIFLLTFIAVYYLNFKYLSTLWLLQ